MTALVIGTDIPTNINTVEKLAFWVATLLAQINPTAQILENPNDTQFVCRVFQFRAQDGSRRLLIRISLPVSDLLDTDLTTKPWQKALEISSTAIPAGFKAN
jgi:hypothetical protein